MISNPDLIHYACIARNNMVLAEFSRSSDLGTLARRCIERAPPFHAVYTHTVRKRTYTFLIGEPLVLFAISDEQLGQDECLGFLGRLRSALEKAATVPAARLRQEGCLQAKFDTVMREFVVVAAAAAEVPNSVSSTPSMSSVSMDGSSSRGQSLGFTPLLGAKLCKGLNLNLKKKRRQPGEPNGDHGKDSSAAGANDDAVDVYDGCTSPPSQKAVSSAGGDRQKAKQVWRKHVWVVLLLDLFVCAVLFGIWLWVCRGFKCVEN